MIYTIVLKAHLSCNCYNKFWQFHYFSVSEIHIVWHIMLKTISIQRMVCGLIKWIRGGGHFWCWIQVGVEKSEKEDKILLWKVHQGKKRKKKKMWKQIKWRLVKTRHFFMCLFFSFIWFAFFVFFSSMIFFSKLHFLTEKKNVNTHFSWSVEMNVCIMIFFNPFRE